MTEEKLFIERLKVIAQKTQFPDGEYHQLGPWHLKEIINLTYWVRLEENIVYIRVEGDERRFLISLESATKSVDQWESPANWMLKLKEHLEKK